MTEKYEDLLREYKKLAKRADQRLVRLEAYSHDKGYNNITKYAYKRAMNDIKRLGGNKRFNSNTPTSTKRLQEKIVAIRKFLDSSTSTKQGVEKVYNKRVNKINEKYGTKFTWQEFKEYFDSNTGRIMERQYGSKTSLKMIGKATREEDDVVQELLDYTKNHSTKESEQFIDDRLALLGLSRKSLHRRL